MTIQDEIDISAIYQDVKELLGSDNSGHDMEHVNRVLVLAEAFTREEGADYKIVQLATLLHDVDDYKLFGAESAENLTNAKRILNEYEIERPVRDEVLRIIGSMGYNKYLEGVRPTSLEGMIVSDADMCDAIGATGILRTHAYALSKGNEFFDPTIAPLTDQLSAEQYRMKGKTHSAQHFFDKLLDIPSILMTESGRVEGQKRGEIMIQFLRQLFQEEGSQQWLERLDRFEKTN